MIIANFAFLIRRHIYQKHQNHDKFPSLTSSNAKHSVNHKIILRILNKPMVSCFFFKFFQVVVVERSSSGYPSRLAISGQSQTSVTFDEVLGKVIDQSCGGDHLKLQLDGCNSESLNFVRYYFLNIISYNAGIIEKTSIEYKHNICF